MKVKRGLLVLFGAALSLISSADFCALGQTGVGLRRPAPVAAYVQYYQAGIQFLDKKEYRKARDYFAETLRLDPFNVDAMYYQSFCMEKLGDKAHATTGYARVISQFPSSKVYLLAVKQLLVLDPPYCRQLQRAQQQPTQSVQQVSTGATINTYAVPLGRPDLDKLPSQCRVDFARRDSHSQLLVINGRLNGRDQKLLFDTGASDCCVGKNNLRDLGITPPKGEPTEKVSGVGSSTTTPAWKMDLNIQVGSISRKIPTLVLEYRDDPLLGQSFFRDFTYTIDTNVGDSERGTIVFTKRNGTAAAFQPNQHAVPFQQLDSSHLLVNVDVDGRKTKMYFDTGASGVVFTHDQLKKLSITIPDDAMPVRNTGVAGETTGVVFPVKRISMGPIDKFDLQIAVVDNATMNYPLLGQSFFHDWKYTIDYDNKVINFQKR